MISGLYALAASPFFCLRDVVHGLAVQLSWQCFPPLLEASDTDGQVI